LVSLLAIISSFVHPLVLNDFFLLVLVFIVEVRIQGVEVVARLSKDHYENIDLLGSDFLRDARVRLTVDYAIRAGVVVELAAST
jgi:hypothetical protein